MDVTVPHLPKQDYNYKKTQDKLFWVFLRDKTNFILTQIN